MPDQDPFAATNKDVEEFIAKTPKQDAATAGELIQKKVDEIDAELEASRVALSQVPKSKANVRNGLIDYIRHRLTERNRLTASMKE